MNTAVKPFQVHIDAIAANELLSPEACIELVESMHPEGLLAAARQLTRCGFGEQISFSKKVFIPLTELCRDVCHYCTFAKTPKRIDKPYLDADEVVALARQGAEQGCKEALFTLGERPELRYRTAREALEAMGFASTLEYVAHVAGRVLRETGLLPHINAGTMDAAEIALLRKVSASMGIMLESASERLCGKGMPHYGSPDKDPAVRLETLEQAGRAGVPFTSGILIGIGETRRERLESLLALREVHQRHGHLQEVIVQNFRAKPGTQMAQAPEPSLDELLWTIAAARLIFGPSMSIQAPPNLSPGVLPALIGAGINDWGGVSPLTPDHVNPEAPWPHLDELAQQSADAGKHLVERLTIYPRYLREPQRWLDEAVTPAVLRLSDGAGLGREDDWRSGQSPRPPKRWQWSPADSPVSTQTQELVTRARRGERLDEQEIARLFTVRGGELAWLCRQADELRRETCGDTVSYVVNRNINYTNICTYSCSFCAFSKGKTDEDLRGRPYDLEHSEIARRVTEAWQRGATEVCLQGGIHPHYTGDTYLQIVRTVKEAEPRMHVHAFSPLEISHGAATLGLPLDVYLARLRDAGLDTLPGTAAEILDDEVRAVLCPDKLGTAEWLTVMRAAHSVGLRTTATIMFGHVEGYHHWARHLLAIRDLQAETGGFTEFVPLPFVAHEAPLYRRGRARPGPTWREALLMHAIARLVLHPLITNIQASWVKLGPEGAADCLNAGVNDLGGSLMNESITRAAGAEHGQELDPAGMERLITALGRAPRQRTTLYGDAPADQAAKSRVAQPLTELVLTPPVRRNASRDSGSANRESSKRLIARERG